MIFCRADNAGIEIILVHNDSEIVDLNFIVLCHLSNLVLLNIWSFIPLSTILQCAQILGTMLSHGVSVITEIIRVHSDSEIIDLSLIVCAICVI
jgi:hypothetical protein